MLNVMQHLILFLVIGSLKWVKFAANRKECFARQSIPSSRRTES